MKDYTDSIIYMKLEMPKHEKPHQKPYADAIEAMERLNPTLPKVKADDVYINCPHCGKPYTYRSKADFKSGERMCNNCGQHMKWGNNTNTESV